MTAHQPDSLSVSQGIGDAEAARRVGPQATRNCPATALT